jgi:hypothetical protein
MFALVGRGVAGRENFSPPVVVKGGGSLCGGAFWARVMQERLEGHFLPLQIRK